jgi:hypothetical protein
LRYRSSSLRRNKYACGNRGVLYIYTKKPETGVARTIIGGCIYMDETNDEILGDPPSVMTAEFINKEGKRYNFEQMAIDAGSFVTILNESGDKIILRFWQTRQSERNYPVDQESGDRYVKDVLEKVRAGLIKL